MAKKLSKDATAPYNKDPLSSQIPALQGKTQHLTPDGEIGAPYVIYSGSETVAQAIGDLKERTATLDNQGKISDENVKVGEDSLEYVLDGIIANLENTAESIDYLDVKINSINADIWEGQAFNVDMGKFVLDFRATVKPTGKMFVRHVRRGVGEDHLLYIAKQEGETVTDILRWYEADHIEPSLVDGKKLETLILTGVNGYTGSGIALVDWNGIYTNYDEYTYADSTLDTDFSNLIFEDKINNAYIDVLNKKTANMSATGVTTNIYGNTGVDRLVFTTAGIGAGVARTQYWDEAYKVLSTVLGDGVVLQNGLEMYVRATNKTGVAITDGSVVYINGAQGNRPTISLAQANSSSGSKVIGVATQAIANNGDGFVTVFGDVSGFNTSGFTAGAELFLSDTAGQLTATSPAITSHKVCVAVALNSTVNGRIFVSPKHIYSIGELHGVDLTTGKTSLAQSEYIMVRDVSGKWMQILKSDFDLQMGRSPLGGTMIKMANGTGAASVKGSIVSASPTTSGRFILQTNEYDAIGVVYENGVADGSDCWIVISGIAEVLLVNGEASTTGQIALSAPTDGRATMVTPSGSPPITTDQHFKEIGHCIETKTAGTNVLVKCVIHFN